ncbi:MAG: hypothetical protein KC996_00175 [Phycisphaerales bacterium]|nr:hypothetical protein [Phycisphaerales bacterium]
MSKVDGGQQFGGGGGGEAVETRPPVSPELLEEEQEAQAEIAELKRTVASLREELAAANEAVAAVERRSQIEQEVSRANAVDLETACLLTEVAIAGMDEPDVAIAVRELRSKKPFLFAGGSGAKRTGGSLMSAMVQRGRSEDLDTMAGEARASGDRGALLRYLQARRACC